MCESGMRMRKGTNHKGQVGKKIKLNTKYYYLLPRIPMVFEQEPVLFAYILKFNLANTIQNL